MSHRNIERSAGDRDNLFGIEGERTLSILPDDILDTRLIKGVLVLPDNKILLSMTLETQSGFGQYGLAMLTAEGKLDPSFHDGGLRIDSFNGDNPCGGGRLLRLADGGLLMLGSDIRYVGVDPVAHLAMARYSSNYELDQSFGEPGTGHQIIENQQDEICMTDFSKVVEQADGKLLICTTYHKLGDWSNTTGVLFRLHPNGTFDKSFKNTGRLDFKMQDSTTPTGLSAVLPQADGKIVVAGYGRLHSMRDTALIARFDNNGLLDQSFGSQNSPGYCGIEVDNRSTRFNDLLSTNRGFVGLGQVGDSNNPDTEGMLFGITQDGLPDPDVNKGEPVLTKYHQDREGAWLNGYVQPDGKLVTTAARHYIYLARWLTNGMADQTFGTDGHISEDSSNAAEPAIVAGRHENKTLWAGNPTGVAGGLGKLIAYLG
ncbi:hypothetical protein HCU66_26950 [Pseudomonas frederiksbergensis]|uniref:hypothetical protein n=1 Tax=Pseudomonas frederiksbergensis TaxID=104087 RepID=UPI00197CF39A|nr:hypothetical protein [Pseudomonas frederiksbergensis]MBN3865827.1 hypothetical protein [Pseudomonas frederiksbergensis]